MTLSVIAKTRALTRTSFLFLWVFVFTALLACSPAPSQLAHAKISGATMGTQYHITAVGEAIDAGQLQRKVDALLVKINKSMSTYDNSSELMLLNNAPVNEWRQLSPELGLVMAQSLELHQLTDGAFDVTVGPLVNRWGFGPDDVDSAPDELEIAALMANLGSRWIELSDDHTRLRKQREVSIDLSAIAKGYGVDAVAELLQSEGIADYLVEIGGELAVRGRNPSGELWRIAIERPEMAQGSVQEAISVQNLAIATSGSYRNYIVYDGAKVSHTIDPVTGKPVTHGLVSVTVLAELCSLADALATGFSVMGPDKTLALAEREQIPVFLLEQQDGVITERWSTAFAPYLSDVQSQQ